MILTVCSFILLACWGIGRLLHPDNSILVETDDFEKQNEEEFTWNDIVFENSNPTDENPWGFTAGIVDLDLGNEYILLSPDTSFVIPSASFYKNDGKRLIKYTIYSQTQEGFGGVSLNICYLDEKKHCIFEEKIYAHNSDEFAEHLMISMEGTRISEIRIECNKENDKDSNCYWVLIK